MTNMVRSFLFLAVGTLLQSCVFPPGYIPERITLKSGDQADWADPDFDDRGWEETDQISEQGRFWVRASIHFDKSIQADNQLGLFVVSIGSFELFLDGVLIGKSGQIGQNIDDEIPGKTISYFPLPDSLAKAGKHLVALRVSNFHSNGHTSFFQFLVADYFKLVRKPLILTSFMYILAGIFLIVGVYYFFLYLKSKNEWLVLTFSMCCFLFFCFDHRRICEIFRPVCLSLSIS